MASGLDGAGSAGNGTASPGAAEWASSPLGCGHGNAGACRAVYLGTGRGGVCGPLDGAGVWPRVGRQGTSARPWKSCTGEDVDHRAATAMAPVPDGLLRAGFAPRWRRGGPLWSATACVGPERWRVVKVWGPTAPSSTPDEPRLDRHRVPPREVRGLEVLRIRVGGRRELSDLTRPGGIGIRQRGQMLEVYQKTSNVEHRCCSMYYRYDSVIWDSSLPDSLRSAPIVPRRTPTLALSSLCSCHVAGPAGRGEEDKAAAGTPWMLQEVERNRSRADPHDGVVQDPTAFMTRRRRAGMLGRVKTPRWRGFAAADHTRTAVSALRSAAHRDLPAQSAMPGCRTRWTGCWHAAELGSGSRSTLT